MTAYAKILYPTDLSPEAEVALPHLAELAKRHGAAITLLHVVEPIMATPMLNDYSMHVDLFDRAITDAITAAKDLGPKVLSKHLGPDVATEIRVVQGHAAQEIVDLARDDGFDLIVMATHGRSGFKRFLLGSVAEKVLRHTSCPVLLVPMAKDR